ncbi:sensor histidine kinase [Nocardia sp. CDC153]|uniref:sensor histidine kinase n=1 Tax=Nocardia sp. CDC153 TaxID=3112167 RepID=UPI002DB62118|nr:sensor histidine kinase [Nocardia sp. CDC153]MEC3952757.1 sensor histidine kinase [Nocardia sp. CDC153]
MRATLYARVSRTLDRLAGIDIGASTTGAPSQMRRALFSSVLAMAWLIYLIAPVSELWTKGHHLRSVLAVAAVLVFGALIVLAFVAFRQPDPEIEQDRPAPARSRVWLLLGVMTALSTGMTVLMGGNGIPTFIYVGVVAAVVLPSRQSVVVVLLMVCIMLAATLLAVGTGGPPFFLAFIPLVVWMGRELGVRAQRLQATARRQRAELAIIEERNRVARDVHDILGHSLTVITVKTELAQRLLDIDPERARAELADIERLARESLAGVRNTVGGLREVTLAGEVANARTALGAAEIAAELPDFADLPVRNNVIFGWVLREAVTNVVRHSGARHCWVRVTPTSIEVSDDGVGMRGSQDSDGAAPRTGSGLNGLRERVRATGGTLTFTNRPEGGLRVLASFPATTKEAE